jgi:insertion element IS1 protein InsB
MVYVPVQCPRCQRTEVIKAGKQANGTQRYQCQNGRCERRIFLLQYLDRGRVLEIRRQMVDLALNGSGIRNTRAVSRTPLPLRDISTTWRRTSGIRPRS